MTHKDGFFTNIYTVKRLAAGISGGEASEKLPEPVPICCLGDNPNFCCVAM